MALPAPIGPDASLVGLTTQRHLPAFAAVAATSIAVAVAITVATAGSRGWGLVGGLLVLAFVPATAAALADLRTSTLPDRLVAATAAVPAVAAVLSTPVVGPRPLLTVAAGASAAALPVLALHLASPAGIGFGDVKFAAALGAVLGLLDWRAGVLMLPIAAAGACACAVATRRRGVPFGPALVAAGAVVAVGLAVVGSPFGQVLPAWH
jgi:leader peptidase (prepilin peptidase) / N-methyltransferase